MTVPPRFAMSCVASDPLVERGWTKISDDVYQGAQRAHRGQACGAGPAGLLCDV